MAKTKRTPMNNTTVSTKIACILCGKKLANLSSLRRHVSRIHGNPTNTRYMCKICKRTYGRRDLYDRHITEKHPFYKIEPEIFKDEVRKEAAIPNKWQRPAEASTKQDWTRVKFKVKPATNGNSPGPPVITPEPVQNTLEMLKDDLQLSDDSSENTSTKTSSIMNLPDKIVDYKKLAYKSVSDATICLDERQ
ncbi:uncharacterized protein LOC117315997 [Pecten maximus]|uniref:uncharacterized protein LOC117315997 n=1 Tax=Pecten maximus TaxID=6579 RepID=UPI0014581AD1|nr:uncharacterized protein LOC117315997 [Pecten maximus]